MLNHPVHIKDNKEDLSLSAFIPFCEFEGNKSVMGKKIDLFEVPVCNSFQAKIFNDQLCYQVDPNKFLNSKKHENLALSFYVDINKDRQFPTAIKEPFKVFLDTLGINYKIV